MSKWQEAFELEARRLATGKLTFSDIELVQDFIQVLLLWHKREGSQEISFRFRNIMQNPETEFLFLKCKDSAEEWVQAEF